MRYLHRTVVAALILASASLAGCATATGALWSEDRLVDAAAARFGVNPASIQITNCVPTGSGTWFTVHLPSGEKHRCFHDGNLMGAGVFSNGVRCGDQAGTAF
ncbi:MAG TPA: hypothetical protein VEA92_02895 [Candidatus Paceibacterota bacterium]|nr:hypothetical protein [Candidatus Paceibacterota bacterium]